MKRVSFLFILFCLIFQTAGPVFAEERKTSDDFAPRPPAEKPVLDPLPETFDPTAAFAVSAAFTVSGVVLTGISIYKTLGALMEEPDSSEVQNGIILTGVCFAGTALCGVLTDFFLDRIRSGRKE